MGRSLPLGLILAGLAASVAVAAPPSSDEYLNDFPDAGGKKEIVNSDPDAEPNALPPSARRELGSSRRDRVLAAVATADELGAPAANGGGQRDGSTGGGTGDPDVGGGDPSALAAAADSLDDPPVALLLAAVLAVGGGLLLARRRGKHTPR